MFCLDGFSMGSNVFDLVFAIKETDFYNSVNYFMIYFILWITKEDILINVSMLFQ